MALDIEGLYRRLGPMVLRRCRALLRNEGQAQDAMHDVFVALLRADQRLDEEAPAGLLLRVATNVCLNRLRAGKRRPETPDDELLMQIAANGNGEARAAARGMLAKLFGLDDPLAASTATLAVMHLCDGMTLEETAREAGLSVSGVRKRLTRLRVRLTALDAADAAKGAPRDHA
ncbi:MAG TPA: sigma-70 family RNA polymerase sigma factor [Polyangia bacterium]